jgi:4'-phosphopantetheinyl transferase
MSSDDSPADPSGIWRDRAGLLTRLGNSVHLWSVRLDPHESEVQPGTALLTQEERDRASRYRLAKDRDRFIARRSMLRQILARYLEREPHEVQFHTGKFGRLELANSCHAKLGFSVAHSQGVALIAVARTCCIGVDLEYVRPLPELDMMIDECLSDPERCQIQALPQSLRLECFYRYWTCKEAYLKALGIGLNRRLDSIQVSFVASDIHCREVEEGEYKPPGLSVWNSEPFSGYVAATATARPQQVELIAI